MRGAKRNRKAPLARVRRALISVMSLLALFAHAFVVQTHVHVAHAGAYAMAEAAQADAALLSQARVDRPIAPSEEPESECDLCQTLASGGAALLSDALALTSISPHLSHTVAVATAFVPVRQAHSWQSRAPPRQA